MTDKSKTDAKDLMNEHSEYELVLIAAREARRLNETARANGKELKRRVTEVAWERLNEGKINFTYEAAPVEEEETLDEAVVAAAEAGPVEDEAPDFLAPPVENPPVEAEAADDEPADEAVPAKADLEAGSAEETSSEERVES